MILWLFFILIFAANVIEIKKNPVPRQAGLDTFKENMIFR